MSWVSVPFSFGFTCKSISLGKGGADRCHCPCRSLVDGLSGLRLFPPTPPARGFNANAPQLQATCESDGNTFPPARPQRLSLQLKLPLLELRAVMPSSSYHQALLPPCASQKTCPNLGLPRRRGVPPLYSCKRPPRFQAPLINSSASYFFAK